MTNIIGGMIERAFFTLLKVLVSFAGFVLSPLIALIPSGLAEAINGGASAITELIEGAIGLAVYLVGPTAFTLIKISIALRIAWWNSALLVNILRKIPFVNQFIKK